MRFIIHGNVSPVEVIGEPFTIDGSNEVFAIHPTFYFEQEYFFKEPWSACHVETGFRIATGKTINEAICNARDVWASKTPEQISAAIQSARAVCQERRKWLEGDE